MKVYSFDQKEERKRILGYSTGDENISVGYNNCSELRNETFHKHTESEEFYIVLEGEMKISVGNEEVILGEGKIIKIEENEPHQIIEITKPPLKIITLKVPDKKDDKVVLS